jgi:hypothetical protein
MRVGENHRGYARVDIRGKEDSQTVAVVPLIRNHCPGSAWDFGKAFILFHGEKEGTIDIDDAGGKRADIPIVCVINRKFGSDYNPFNTAYLDGKALTLRSTNVV